MSIARRYSPPNTVFLKDDQLPVTMQIGMIGKGCIVLASDTKWSTTYAPDKVGRFDELRDEYGGWKILLSPAKDFAVSRADDMVAATEIAEQIVSTWKPDQDSDGETLRTIVDPLCADISFQCIVAVMRPEPRLFYVSYDLRYPGETPLVKKIEDRVCAGDRANAAKFWHLRYYDRSLSVEDLKRLGAYLVVEARNFNNGVIDGLEIVVSDGAEFRHLARTECDALEAGAKELAGEIRTLFFRQATWS